VEQVYNKFIAKKKKERFFLCSPEGDSFKLGCFRIVPGALNHIQVTLGRVDLLRRQAGGMFWTPPIRRRYLQKGNLPRLSKGSCGNEFSGSMKFCPPKAFKEGYRV
jgi:hypothetical protein